MKRSPGEALARNSVGEHLERNVPVENSSDEISREGFVVTNAGFLEQRRIGRESRDPRLLRHFDDLTLVRTIGKKLDLQIGELRHDSPCPFYCASAFSVRRLPVMDGLYTGPGLG